jgi:pyruvate dehydrogenase E2 component (dihydrolipoamide acetyltransferase)
MSVSVRMPQLGESVTEGTVTRWLKKEGDLVSADEPLLEVSTDKVDTEIPSPASGVLRGIAVAEEETVEVGAELAVIEEVGAELTPVPPSGGQPSAVRPSGARPSGPQPSDSDHQTGQYPRPAPVPPLADTPSGQAPRPQAQYEQAPAAASSLAETPATPWPAQPPSAGDTEVAGPTGATAGSDAGAPAGDTAVDRTPAAPPGPAAVPTRPPGVQPRLGAQQQFAPLTPLPGAGEGPYITPLVRKLAGEYGVDLASVQGTGVGGRIRKQDVIEASRALQAPQAATPTPSGAPPYEQAAPPAARQYGAAPAATGVPGTAPAAPAAVQPTDQRPASATPQVSAPDTPASPGGAPLSDRAPRPAVEPSPLRGTTERMSRLRQVIAQRMVDSLHTSAQLTTVIEADVTKIARLRQRAKADFEKREGVRLSFLPFFALATLEALKMHPRLNAVIDTEKNEVTYYDVEHLGIAVDTERGLLVPVIRNAGDLNIGGLARKIDDLARRTRSGQVSPDELSGGTFTLTNTGSRGAIFDTPIINQPQVAILGTGSVVKRPVVLDDPDLGEVIAVRSIVYLALTYDHRLVDGADAARFVGAVKTRLEEGTFEAELGL